MTTSRTQVAIVGGGPSGLMVSHLLHRSGIACVVVDNRTVEEIRTTHRAGVLERDSVRLLAETGVSETGHERVVTHGDRHGGIYLRFAGESHHIDFVDLVGASVWLYPQTDVFVDLHAARTRDGGDLRYGITDTAVHDLDSDRPRVTYADADGRAHEVIADLVVGADDSRSTCRDHVEGRSRYFREYPFAWFGIHFSYWMTTMLHRAPGRQEHQDFDELSQLGELASLVSSEAGATYLAEGCTGWPTP